MFLIKSFEAKVRVPALKECHFHQFNTCRPRYHTRVFYKYNHKFQQLSLHPWWELVLNTIWRLSSPSLRHPKNGDVANISGSNLAEVPLTYFSFLPPESKDRNATPSPNTVAAFYASVLKFSFPGRMGKTQTQLLSKESPWLTQPVGDGLCRRQSTKGGWWERLHTTSLWRHS